jgi:hypothetical protein
MNMIKTSFDGKKVMMRILGSMLRIALVLFFLFLGIGFFLGRSSSITLTIHNSSKNPISDIHLENAERTAVEEIKPGELITMNMVASDSGESSFSMKYRTHLGEQKEAECCYFEQRGYSGKIVVTINDDGNPVVKDNVTLR